MLFTSKNKGASTFGNPVVKAWSNPKAFENPCSIKFELSTELDRSGPKPYWIPKIVNAGKTDDALLKWFNDIGICLTMIEVHHLVLLLCVMITQQNLPQPPQA